MPLTPVFRKQRQEDVSEFKDSLVYIEISMPSKDISQKTNQQQQKNKIGVWEMYVLSYDKGFKLKEISENETKKPIGEAHVSGTVDDRMDDG